MRGYGPDGADKVGDRTYSKRTVDGALSSPPFTDQLPCKDPLFAAQLPGAGVAMQSGYSSDAAIASPPYSDQQITGSSNFYSGKDGRGMMARDGHALDGYDGAAGAITSPPYSDAGLPPGVSHAVRKLALAGQWDEAIALVEQHEADQVKRGTRMALKSRETIRAHIEAALDSEFGYSGAMSSPPYVDSLSQDSAGGIDWSKQADRRTQPRPSGQGVDPTSYGKSQAQIGNLRDPKNDIDAVLSSPPYSNLVSTAEQRGKPSSGWLEARGIHHNLYGREPGQIGNLPDDPAGANGNGGPAKKETYLGAMLRVYHQLYRVLRPGGVVCLVTKNPVKDKQIRRLDADTIRLMEACGFRLIERHAAMLAEETQLPSLFDAEAPITKRKERKSFFKRLYERRNPDLRVDHEDVLWFQKPN